MKKILALMLILGMASAASAVPFLTINGEPAPDEITLVPSDWIELDIEIDIGLVGGELIIELSNEQGMLDPADVVLNPDYCNVYIPGTYVGYLPWDFQWGVKGATPTSIAIGGGNFSAGNLEPDLWLMQGLMFHCTHPTDVVITLIAGVGGLDYAGTDVQEGTILDSIYVTQPEPTTIA